MHDLAVSERARGLMARHARAARTAAESRVVEQGLAEGDLARRRRGCIGWRERAHIKCRRVKERRGAPERLARRPLECAGNARGLAGEKPETIERRVVRRPERQRGGGERGVERGGADQRDNALETIESGGALAQASVGESRV